MLVAQWERLRSSRGWSNVLARAGANDQNWEHSEARARFWAELQEGRETAARSKAHPQIAREPEE